MLIHCGGKAVCKTRIMESTDKALFCGSAVTQFYRDAENYENHSDHTAPARAMSIDTLLEAARYLEWQAQQQQITREAEQQREKVLLVQEAEQRRAEVTSMVQPIHVTRVTWSEETRHPHHPPVPPPPLPPPVPIAVIPIPVVSASPAVPQVATATTLHSAPPVPVVASLTGALPPTSGALLSPPVNDSNSPVQPQPQQHRQQRPLLASVKAEVGPLPQSGSSPKKQTHSSQPLLQPYPGSIITTPQHALLPQPQPGQLPRTNNASLEDSRSLEGKRRPGGAGTREVHNKLEKNRRAHLKECFETLKRNVPNVDEKKTSNLSVLRSALRYIQTLKRKEKEYEHEMERLAREKISTQQRLAELKNELSQNMDIMEIDRILRQTVQPEDDQASTSTASEGEDNFEQDVEDDVEASSAPLALPKAPLAAGSDAHASILPSPPVLPPNFSIQQKPSLPPSVPSHPQTAVVTAAPVVPSHLVPPLPLPPPPQPTVIAHASVSHASVIQAVNHVLPPGTKHLAHIAPSGGAQPIGHITVHPVAHLPALYQSQAVSVAQPTVVGHITHTLAHGHVNGTPAATAVVAAPSPQAQQGAAVLGKPTAMVAHHHHHHTGLVGQTTVLNPVTMVTMPPFPVSTLKLA